MAHTEETLLEISLKDYKVKVSFFNVMKQYLEEKKVELKPEEIVAIKEAMVAVLEQELYNLKGIAEDIEKQAYRGTLVESMRREAPIDRAEKLYKTKQSNLWKNRLKSSLATIATVVGIIGIVVVLVLLFMQLQFQHWGLKEL